MDFRTPMQKALDVLKADDGVTDRVKKHIETHANSQQEVQLAHLVYLMGRTDAAHEALQKTIEVQRETSRKIQRKEEETTASGRSTD